MNLKNWWNLSSIWLTTWFRLSKNKKWNWPLNCVFEFLLTSKLQTRKNMIWWSRYSTSLLGTFSACQPYSIIEIQLNGDSSISKIYMQVTTSRLSLSKNLKNRSKRKKLNSWSLFLQIRSSYWPRLDSLKLKMCTRCSKLSKWLSNICQDRSLTISGRS